MIVELPTEQHLEILSLKGGCTGSSESTLVEMPHCWKSHVTARLELLDMSVVGINQRPLRICEKYKKLVYWSIVTYTSI